MVIDLRSDTITKPTAEMRRAIAEAEVGDDVFGDDPTVNHMEACVAELLGKEAALFVPSGTMSNQIALRVHTQPGDEIIIDANAHVYFYEAGGPAALSGVMTRLLNGRRGIFTAADVKAALRPKNIHFAPTKLVCVENTHNRGGGSIWPLEKIDEVAEVARENGLKMHMDGARLWNASAATGIAESEYARYFDSVSVCFSKGLGAPVGSALVGEREFVERARRIRKMFGGGMRQAGLLAAGVLYALQNHRERLKEDHANARFLAEGLAEIPGIDLDISTVETNIVCFGVNHCSADEMVARVGERGVGVLPIGPDTVRAVTNLMVTREDIEKAVDIFRGI